jgi:transposase-like protein
VPGPCVISGCGSFSELASGQKQVLRLRIEQTDDASFGCLMNEIKAHGAQDVLIAIVDGLKGYPEAITAVFPMLWSRRASCT